MQHLLAASGALSSLPEASQRILTGREFFPELISGPFHQGLTVVFIVATVLAAVAAIASLMRGGRHVPPAAADEPVQPTPEPVHPSARAAADGQDAAVQRRAASGGPGTFPPGPPRRTRLILSLAQLASAV